VAASTLPEYPAGATRDLEHVRLLAERFDKYLEGARRSRRVAEELSDDDSVDLMTQIVQELERHAWFLRATIA
jgi:starvation-inducible DNA-binding protein